MGFTMTISTDNDAFATDATAEIARILRETTRRVVNGHMDGVLLDVNGNRVGRFDVTP
jgi:hypothetical protein